MEDAERFLTWTFADAVAREQKIVLWCAPSKECRTFSDPAAAARWAAGREAENVYAGAGTRAHPVKGGRGKADDVEAIVALWADVDCGTGHKKPNLPPDEAAALALAREMGAEPSIVVHSGHGLQAWWLLDAPWIFADAADRQAAAALEARWIATLRALAERRGWTVDAVQDLARVMRLPGTWNTKHEPRVLARILLPVVGEPRRYARSELEALLAPEEHAPPAAAPPSAKPVPAVDFVAPRPDAGTSARVAALCENDARFRRTWERRRQDLKDQSPSGYDLSIASQLVAAGLPDQEIADALGAWRRKHGEPQDKLLRRDYLMRTLAKARERRAADLAGQRLDDALKLPPPEEPEDAANRRRLLLAEVSHLTGIAIARVLQHGRENATYSLLLQDGTDVLIGGERAILDLGTVRERLLTPTKIAIGKVKFEDWMKACEALVRAAEYIENPEVERRHKGTEWVRSYMAQGGRGISGQLFFRGERLEEAVQGRYPFLDDGHIYIPLQKFARHVRFQTEERVTERQLTDILRLVGFQAREVKRGNARGYYWVGDRRDFPEIRAPEGAGNAPEKNLSEAGVGPEPGEMTP